MISSFLRAKVVLFWDATKKNSKKDDSLSVMRTTLCIFGCLWKLTRRAIVLFTDLSKKASPFTDCA